MAGNQHVQPKTVPHWLSTVEVCENIRRVWSICAFDQMRNVFGQWHLMKQRCLFFRRANILTNTKLIFSEGLQCPVHSELIAMKK